MKKQSIMTCNGVNDLTFGTATEWKRATQTLRQRRNCSKWYSYIIHAVPRSWGCKIAKYVLN